MVKRDLAGNRPLDLDRFEPRLRGYCGKITWPRRLHCLEDVGMSQNGRRKGVGIIEGGPLMIGICNNNDGSDWAGPAQNRNFCRRQRNRIDDVDALFDGEPGGEKVGLNRWIVGVPSPKTGTKLGEFGGRRSWHGGV